LQERDVARFERQTDVLRPEEAGLSLLDAKARLYKIILDIQPTTMSSAILDDGVGLPMQVESSAGMGLKLLRYRANLLRARIRIQPGSTRGTYLIFTIEQQP
jgi:nitrate/nitrite-specific signal transduction histidine kinase